MTSDYKENDFWLNKWLIEPNHNQISDENETHSLEPIVMKVLICLASNAPDVVRREDIISQVWSGRAVSESSLNRNIAKLRKLLDADAQGQSCIKTIPKKGYCLIAVPKHKHLNMKSINPAETGSKVAETTPTESRYIRNVDKESQVKSAVYPNANKLNKYGIRISLAALLVISVLTIFFQAFSHTNPDLAESDSQNNATWQATHEITLTPKKTNRAFCLDGLKDYIEVPDNDLLNVGTRNFSVSAWVKTFSNGVLVIMDKRDESKESGVRGYNLHLWNGSVGFQLGDRNGNWECENHSTTSSCSNYSKPTFINDGKWHNIVISVDRNDTSGLKFYVDGKFTSKHDPTDRSGSLSNTKPLRIGSRSSSETGLFPGSIGEVKVMHSVLTPKEIKLLYDIGQSRTCDI